MRALVFLLILIGSVDAASSHLEDDEDLFANLNKTLLDIINTPSNLLSDEELSAASGVYIPTEHRLAAEELFDRHRDRPMRSLLANMMEFGKYTEEEAEEFSRGAMRVLLDKPYLLAADRKLRPGDHLCRCNLRECASVHNELYAIMGPEMSTFCRVDKYGYCMTATKKLGNSTKVDLFCAYSASDREQRERHDTVNDEHFHVCMSTKQYGRSCCKGAMCNDAHVESMDPLETALEERVKNLDIEVLRSRNAIFSLAGLVILLLVIVTFFSVFVYSFTDSEKVIKATECLLDVPYTFFQLDAEFRRKRNAARRRIFQASSPDLEGGGMGMGGGGSSIDDGSSHSSLSSVPLINSSMSSAASTTSSASSGIGSANPSMGEPATCNNSSNATTTTMMSKSFLDETTVGCGTGTGGNLVAQRTISSFIRLTQPLGQGRFGKVFLGEWRGGEKIAVKKFDHVLYEAFEQEVEILMSGMMSNSNILRWIGKDCVDTGSTTEFWIMSEYHPNGSLYDYMETTPLSQHTFLTMMRGCANGISFLHSEIPAMEGTTGKKGVAHRDLKTKNILVKSDLTCVIADFGMAVMNDGTRVKLPQGNKKSGTVRYVAPEVILDNLSPIVSEFEYYRASDMYSFALIMWECARRTHAVFGRTAIAEHSMEESLAYYTDVPREPSLADMKEAIVDKELRPPIDELWNRNPVFFEMSRIMRECWSTNAGARLTALNVKIVIDRLSSQHNLMIKAGYD